MQIKHSASPMKVTFFVLQGLYHIVFLGAENTLFNN